MKLLTKTSLLYIISSVLVFAAGGFIFYENLRSIVDEETAEDLFRTRSRIEAYAETNHRLPPASYEANPGDYIRETGAPVQQHLSDTMIYVHDEGEMLPFRQLTFPLETNGRHYAMRISRALFEADDLVEGILGSFITTIVVLLVVVVVANRFMSGVLLRPLFSLLDQLGKYKIGGSGTLQPAPTSTKEFAQLNRTVKQMTEKIQADYAALKSFTENASHELQTPLAVILSSTEQLLQRGDVGGETAEEVQRIHQTARRLSRLNQTLLLLTKIENNQFATGEKIDLSALVSQKAAAFEELNQDIRMEKQIDGRVQLAIHPVLAEILVTNLLSNAARHNTAGPDGARIRVTLRAGSLLVCNTGRPVLEPGKIFTRFYKENPSPESTGLGLALVKQIADSNGLQILYRFENGYNCFEILF